MPLPNCCSFLFSVLVLLCSTARTAAAAALNNAPVIDVLAEPSTTDPGTDLAHPTQQYRPVVIMHGMNNNEHGYNKLIDVLERQYPGIYVTALAVYDDTSSMLTPMDKQLAAVTAAIQSNPKLQSGFNFYGESQGALLARAYVTTSNNPPVHNLVALCGPQAGVGECPTIDGPWKNVCGDLGTDLDLYAWPFCSFCGYWKGNVDHANYLTKSKWLAKINNDRWNSTGGFNQTYRSNMISLNQYMATYAELDQIVQPRESAWHSFWKWGDKNRDSVNALNETDGYIHDVLGLKTLHERGDLILNHFHGAHVDYNMNWWNATVLPMFGN